MPPKLRPTQAVYLLAVLTIIAIAMLVSSLLWDLRTRDLEHGRQETASLTRMLMDQTEQSFHGADLALRSIQDRLQTTYGNELKLDSFPVQLLLSTRILGLRQVNALFVLDTDGAFVNSSNQSQMYHVSAMDHDYFKALSKEKKTGLFISKPRRNGFNGIWTLYLARRVYDMHGKFRGVAVAAVNLEHFEEFYGYIGHEFLRPIGLYLNDTTLIASMPRRYLDMGKPASELQSVRISASDNNVRMFSRKNEGGEKYVFVLGNVSEFPLLVSVTDNEAVTLAAWRGAAIMIVLGTLLVCIFIGIAAALLAIELRREESLTFALQEADDRYRLTIDSVMDAIISIDESQDIIMFNAAAERMFGMPASEAFGKPLAMLVPELRREMHGRHIRSFMKSAVPSRAMAMQMEIFGLHADGHEFPIESAISQTVIHGKLHLTVVLRDITDRHLKEAKLREMNSELRRLSISLQSVREEERTRISRELHDELGQQLTGLKLDLTWFGARLKEGRQPAPEALDSMRHMLDDAIVSVRRISTELRPRILDDLDFGEAVSWQIEELTKRNDIQVTCHIPAATLVKDNTLATALFRIVQEALTNVARHAMADRLEINLVKAGDSLILSVRDSGRGFVHDSSGSGIGLVSMRERATALGGKFTIISEPGRGTTIEVQVPFNVPVPVGDEV